MGQRLPLHIAEIARAAGMATLAPTRAVTRAVVVIHRLNRKTGCARVAGVAAHAGAGEQLGLVGDVIIRFGQPRPTRVVTGRAGPWRNAGVTKYPIGKGRVTRMTAVARGRGGDMTRWFAERVPGGVGAVMARRTLAGHDPLRR